MTTTYIVQLTQPPRLGSWVVPSQHCTPGSSQASYSTTGTTPLYNITTEGDTGPPYTPSLPLTPTTAVELQHSLSEGSEAGAEEPSSEPRQPRRAALRQRELLRSLIDDDLI